MRTPSQPRAPQHAQGPPPEHVEIEEVVTAAKAHALAALDITTKSRGETADHYRLPARRPSGVS